MFNTYTIFHIVFYVYVIFFVLHDDNKDPVAIELHCCL